MSSALESLLGGGGGGPPATIPDPEPHLAPGGAGENEATESGGDEVSTLKDLVSSTKAYMEIPSVDESERLEATKALQIFQKLLASNEKMSDQVSGASPALRKALTPSGPPA